MSILLERPRIEQVPYAREYLELSLWPPTTPEEIELPLKFDRRKHYGYWTRDSASVLFDDVFIVACKPFSVPSYSNSAQRSIAFSELPGSGSGSCSIGTRDFAA